MIYTRNMQKAIRSVSIPHEFMIDIMEYDLDPKNPFISIRFYESQWEYYNDSERYDCAIYLGKIQKILTSYGIKVTLEPCIDTGNTVPDKFKTKGNGFLK